MRLENKKILVIDDTQSIRTFLRISLQSNGAIVHEAASANEGFALCKEIEPDLVVLDLGLPDKDGLDILPEIKEAVNTKVIILSVRKEPTTKLKAFSRGASAYMSKPFLMDDLLALIERQFAV